MKGGALVRPLFVSCLLVVCMFLCVNFVCFLCQLFTAVVIPLLHHFIKIIQRLLSRYNRCISGVQNLIQLRPVFCLGFRSLEDNTYITVIFVFKFFISPCKLLCISNLLIFQVATFFNESKGICCSLCT